MSSAVLKRDRIEEFIYDPATKRYRWRGVGGGQFASKKVVLRRLETYIDEQRTSIQGLGQALIDKKIDLTVFQKDVGERLKNIHISQAVIGHDGVEEMAGDDWLRVGRELKRQYYQGKDGDRRYGIKHLAQEIADGNVSAAQLLNRLDMYGLSGKVSHSEAFKAHNMGSLAIRILGNTDKHCGFCIEQAAKPPQPIEEVASIGCCPQCLTRCRCKIEVVDK